MFGRDYAPMSFIVRSNSHFIHLCMDYRMFDVLLLLFSFSSSTSSIFPPLSVRLCPLLPLFSDWTRSTDTPLTMHLTHIIPTTHGWCTVYGVPDTAWSCYSGLSWGIVRFKSRDNGTKCHIQVDLQKKKRDKNNSTLPVHCREPVWRVLPCSLEWAISPRQFGGNLDRRTRLGPVSFFFSSLS